MRSNTILIALFLVASFLPLSASAAGFPIFSGWPSDYVTQYGSALSADLSKYSSQLTSHAWPLPPASQFVNAGDWFTFFNKDSTGDPGTISLSTATRLCQLIDPSAVSNSTVGDTSWYGNNGDAASNRNYFYTPTAIAGSPAGWSDRDPNGNGCPGGGDACHYSIKYISCLSYAPPGQTLLLDKTTITAGQSAKLSWNDTLARDYFSQFDPGVGTNSGAYGEPDPAQVAGATPHNGTIELGTTNDGASPNSVCTSINWNSQAPAGGYWAESIYFVCLQGTPGHCTEPDYRTKATWVTTTAATPTAESKSGSVTVSPTTTTTYTYSCTNANGTRTVSATVNVAASAKPDLTVSTGVSPTTATTGSATTFSATVQNQGSAATGTGFPDLFEVSTVNNPALFSQLTATRSYTSAALSAGTSNVASASYTFPSAGTWYVRACANTDTSGNTPATSYTGTPESTYGNNCGAWTPITVASPSCTNGAINPTACTQCPNNLAYIGGSCVSCSNGGCTGGGGSSGNPTGSLTCNNGATNPASCNAFPPSCSTLSATPSDINTGDKVSLTWSCANASSCTQIANSDGFSTGGRLSGTDNSVKPSVSSGQVTYGMTCGGTNFYFPPVTVHSPKATLSASAGRVQSGGSITLTGTGTDVKSCSITDTTHGQTIVASSPATSGFWQKTSSAQTITGQTTYALTCKGSGTSVTVTSATIVNILPSFKEF